MTRVRELSLDEMLADPIVHLLMHRDGIQEDQVRELMARARLAAPEYCGASGSAAELTLTAAA